MWSEHEDARSVRYCLEGLHCVLGKLMWSNDWFPVVTCFPCINALLASFNYFSRFIPVNLFILMLFCWCSFCSTCFYHGSLITFLIRCFYIYCQEWDCIFTRWAWQVGFRSKFCTRETWQINERVWASGEFVIIHILFLSPYTYRYACYIFFPVYMGLSIS